jgi:hypothetical protein
MQQKVGEIKKRIEHLDKLLMQKKSLVENEMFQIENICKEIIKLHEQLSNLEEKKDD